MFQYGDTPLHTSARYGHAGVLRILISAQCKVSEQNKVSIDIFLTNTCTCDIVINYKQQINICF